MNNQHNRWPILPLWGKSAGGLGAGLLIVLASVLSTACALTPEARLERTAAESGFLSGDVQAGPFSLRYFYRQTERSTATLNVYLEGDGTPWLTPTRVAANPSPREPLALDLMAQDAGHAIYLSRPCYLGRQGQPPCRPWLWTHGRYSETVVRAMATALEQLIRQRAPEARVRLIGHSGGGVLAVLLAERLAPVVEVVTIGANLDIDAWADGQGYSRLDGSLNPAKRPGLPARIRQVHLFGARDTQVPAAAMIDALRNRTRATFILFDGFDHRCCWAEHWRALLEALRDLRTLCEQESLFGRKVTCIPTSPV